MSVSVLFWGTKQAVLPTEQTGPDLAQQHVDPDT